MRRRRNRNPQPSITGTVDQVAPFCRRRNSRQMILRGAVLRRGPASKVMFRKAYSTEVRCRPEELSPDLHRASTLFQPSNLDRLSSNRAKRISGYANRSPASANRESETIRYADLHRWKRPSDFPELLQAEQSPKGVLQPPRIRLR